MQHSAVGDEPAIALAPDVQEIRATNEISDKAVHRGVVDRVRGAFLHHMTAFHHDDAVRHGKRLGLVVCHVDRRDFEFTLDSTDFEPCPVAQACVKVGEGFVKQQEVWMPGDGARQRDPLLLTA